MKQIAFILTTLLFTGCATTLTDKAAKIQVHSQMSTLLTNCKNLGPISASAEDFIVGTSKASNDAKVKAREEVADKGGDTLVITNIDGFNATSATVQGVALRCY